MISIGYLPAGSRPPGHPFSKIHRAGSLVVLFALMQVMSASAHTPSKNITVHTVPEDSIYYGPEDEPLKADPLMADEDGVFRPKPNQFKKRISNNPSHSESFESAVKHYRETGSKKRFLQTAPHGCSYSLIATACCELSGEGPRCAVCPGQCAAPVTGGSTCTIDATCGTLHDCSTIT